MVAVRAELDSRSATRTKTDEDLKNELPQRAMKVHEKVVDLENTIAAMRQQATDVPRPRQRTRTDFPVPPGMGHTTRKYKVEPRNWGDHRRPDLDIQHEGVVAWRDRTLGLHSANRPDVRKLLLWAEKQAPAISSVEEQKGTAEANLRDDVEHVSYVIFETANMIMSHSLLSRTRTCGDGRGLEVWRQLQAECRGSAPQVCRRESVQIRRPSALRDDTATLGGTAGLGATGFGGRHGGYPIPFWVRSQALEKLVLENLLQVIVGRPELADYGAKLMWVINDTDRACTSGHAGAPNRFDDDENGHGRPYGRIKKTRAHHWEIDRGSVFASFGLFFDGFQELGVGRFAPDAARCNAPLKPIKK
jgi:hypothetical protein